MLHKLIIVINLVIVVHGQDPDFYEQAKIIDRNVIRDYYKFIISFRNLSTTIDSGCSQKLLQNYRYSGCYTDSLRRWRYEKSREKLACCFLLDYEKCMFDLIYTECGAKSERKYRHQQAYRVSKKHMIEMLNCHDYQHLDDCRLPLWAIILIIIASSLIFASTLIYLLRYFKKRDKIPPPDPARWRNQHVSLVSGISFDPIRNKMVRANSLGAESFRSVR